MESATSKGRRFTSSRLPSRPTTSATPTPAWPLSSWVRRASGSRRTTRLENARRDADILRDRLAEITDRPHVGEVRQRGVMVGIELVADRQTRQPFPPAERMGHQVTLAARRRGVIVRPLGDVVVLMPAPAMPGKLLDRLCDVVFEAIDEATG